MTISSESCQKVTELPKYLVVFLTVSKELKEGSSFFFKKLLFIYFWLLWVLVVAHGLQSAWAQLLYGMWDHPWSGIEPVSPMLEGGLPPTGPPGKSQNGSSDQAKNKMEKSLSYRKWLQGNHRWTYFKWFKNSELESILVERSVVIDEGKF